MRLKNVPGAREFVALHPYTISEPATYKGRWSEVFGNDHPIHLEIGMGKGRFLMTMAMQNPQINFIGMEMYSSVLMRALQKQNELQLTNIRFICMDARLLEDIFSPGEIRQIYLNFSDPWPKERHAKRRLTSPQFLARYRKILPLGACVRFKTDNRDLFEFSLASAQESDWLIRCCSYDLHHSDYAQGNVMTEYEERFSSKGNPIFLMEIVPPNIFRD